jgi:hypothetical protein
MAAYFVSRGPKNMLRRALFSKPCRSLFYSGMRAFTSGTDTAQDEYRFETLTGDLEGKIEMFYFETNLSPPPPPPVY